MHRVVDLFRDAVGGFCAFLTARIRPSQRALQIARIERELRATLGQLVVLSSRIAMLELADSQRLTFDDMTRRLKSEGS